MKRVVFGLALIALSAGCGLQGQVKRIGKVDFEKTEIIASDIAIADGQDDLVVAVHLKNSNNSVVPNYKPEYEITSGSGVIASPCTTSSSDGISVCILRAVTPGSKRLALKNAKVGLAKDVMFAKRGTSALSGLVPGSNVQVGTAGGYKANLAVGPWVASDGVSTNGGYKAYISVQGAMDSR
jgi:hypothetical protein